MHFLLLGRIRNTFNETRRGKTNQLSRQIGANLLTQVRKRNNDQKTTQFSMKRSTREAQGHGFAEKSGVGPKVSLRQMRRRHPIVPLSW